MNYYAGWDDMEDRDPTIYTVRPTYQERKENALRSDHGELREVDEYPGQGAAFWVLEQSQ